MVCEFAFRLPEVALRLLGAVEAVDVSAGFDENLCERETEAASAACDDEDAVVELP